MLATRATQVVDLCFARGPARPSPYYGALDGHPVPTPSLVAWLLAAAEFGIPLDELAQRRNPALDGRQHVLRTLVNRALQGRPELFDNQWLGNLARICHLGTAERELLATSRDESGQDVDPRALRRAIARTMRTRRAVGAAVTEKMATSTRALPRDNASFTGREQAALQICGNLGYRGGEANALHYLAATRRLTGDYSGRGRRAGGRAGHLPGHRRPGGVRRRH